MRCVAIAGPLAVKTEMNLTYGLKLPMSMEFLTLNMAHAIILTNIFTNIILFTFLESP